MAAFLGWQQKWGILGGTGLTWADAWTEGFLVGDTTLALATGHMTLAVSGFEYKIAFALGDVTLDMLGVPTTSANVTMNIPGDYILGNLRLDMYGRTTLNAAFDSVDPWWLDGTNYLQPTGRMAFPNLVTMSYVLSKQLGAVTLTMQGHAGLPQSLSVGNTVSKALGAVTLNMIAGPSMTADIVSRSGDALALGDVTLDVFGRMATSSNNLRALLPPWQIGDLTLDLGGQIATSVINIFAGGPFNIGALSIALTGKFASRFDLAYPPFDVDYGIEAIVDPSVTPIIARVEPDSVQSQ